MTNKRMPVGTAPVAGPVHPLQDEHQVAEILNCTVAKVRAMRQDGTGPLVCKVGRLVRYRVDDLLAWMEAQLATSTSAPVKAKTGRR